MTRASAVRLKGVVEYAARALAALDDTAAGHAPAPGKWSPKQVVGHLIDSATINHQRFMQAAGGASLVFDTYDQDRFVELQEPADVPWGELLDLWRLLNLHIARVMEATPASLLTTPHELHNLHQIAFRRVPPGEAVTLEYLMLDYVEHLLHHLRQVDPALVPDG
jgi:hypothetical protein